MDDLTNTHDYNEKFLQTNRQKFLPHVPKIPDDHDDDDHHDDDDDDNDHDDDDHHDDNVFDGVELPIAGCRERFSFAYCLKWVKKEYAKEVFAES